MVKKICLLIQVVCADILEDTGDVTVRELTEKYGDGRVIFVKCDVGKLGQVERKHYYSVLPANNYILR